MKNSRKPWLNWENSLALAEEEKLRRKNLANKKRKRSRFSAIILLVLAGYAGFHRFYVYDSKKAWLFFLIYLVLVLFLGFIFSGNIEEAPKYVVSMLIVYWMVIILVSYKPLMTDVDRINSEVENYD